MNPFSILMVFFAVGILLYAGLVALLKDPKLIPRDHASNIKDPKAYATAFAKLLAFMALAPLGSAFYSLFSIQLGLAMLIVNFVLCMWAGVRLFWNQ